MPVVLATQPDKALPALGLCVVVQLLGSWFLAPRIRGGSVNLTPAATILVLALGGAIAGPLGIILALPAAALLRDLASYTSHRAGGLSPLESLEQLPSFSRFAESRRPAVEAQHCQRPT
jgi:predicted PurR-regulated permease PerM